MGFYVNPGNAEFKAALSSEIYVDKSMLLSELNKRIGTEDRFICVSRPRRFGKTMAESMMAAYYSRGCDSSELFKDLEIAGDPGFAMRLNKYNVIHVDVNGFLSDCDSDPVGELKKRVMREFAMEFPDADYSGCMTISDCIMETHYGDPTPFVVIFDEYDAPFREKISSKVEEDYLKLLNALFKDSATSSCIALAYLTGILPIIRDKAQSKLNNFEEITFLNPRVFTPYTGFTAKEVNGLCNRFGMDFDECRRWYDGYRIGGSDLYAPRSVVLAMRYGECAGYWSATSQYGVISDAVRFDIEGTKNDVERMISGESVSVNITRFLNTPREIRGRDEIFTYLCHLGYLSYDPESETCRIPNREIRSEWVNAMEDLPEHGGMLEMIRNSKDLLASAWAMDGSAVAAALARTHEKLTSPLSYNNEKSFQSAIRLAFFYADLYYTIISELPSGKGYADLAFIPYKPNIPAMLIELKVKGTAQTAIDQINEKRYFAGLDKYEGNILLVGVSYDSETKEHACVIDSK